jgi:transcription antitermination factor NusG
MNAISPQGEDFSCIDTDEHGSNTSSRSSVHDLDTAPCSGNLESGLKTSARWGGARENSGGPRPGFGGPQPGSGRPRKQVKLAKPAVSRWYVLELQSGQERVTVADLSLGEFRQGYIQRPQFEMFLPQTNVVRVVRGKRVIAAIPMLAGYGFSRFNAQTDPWSLMLHCAGVRKLLRTDGKLIPVLDRDVARLRALSEMELGIDPLAMTVREPGTVMTVADGPFAMFRAVCVECDGITTTADVEIFGRSCPLTLPYAMFTDGF